jgi:hypothetical protein
VFAELMAELYALRAAGAHTPGHPTVYDLTDGPKALAELAAGATVGKLALRPWVGSAKFLGAWYIRASGGIGGGRGGGP